MTHHFLAALPAVAAAIFAGRAANRRMDGPTFIRCIHIRLILAGAALLLQAVAPPG